MKLLLEKFKRPKQNSPPNILSFFFGGGGNFNYSPMFPGERERKRMRERGERERKRMRERERESEEIF